MAKMRAPGYVALFCAALGLALLIFFFPSARQKRRKVVLAELEKTYGQDDPKEVAELLKGHFIIDGNNYHPIRPDEAGFIMVWAPVPGSRFAFSTLGEFLRPIPASNYRKYAKKQLLIAPHPSCQGWTLLGKLVMADNYQHKPNRDFFNLQGNLAANPAVTIPRIKAMYDAVPKEVQERVEQDLQENRAVLYKYQKTRTLFQTGLGQYLSMHDMTLDRCINMAGDSLPFQDAQK